MNDIIQQFRDIRMATRKDEVWRNVDFGAMMPEGLSLPDADEAHEGHYYCNMPDLDAVRLTLVNGRCVQPLTVTEEGIVYGSLREAMDKYPELVKNHLGKCKKSDNAYERLNLNSFSDGMFLYVPDNTSIDKSFQMVSMTDSDHQLFLQTRNLVVVGKGSRLRLIHCDDSHNNSRSMSNNVTEIFAGEGSYVEHYKLQNMNDLSGLLNHNYICSMEGAELHSFVISLNGGHIRNHTEIRMLGEHCVTEAHGLYLIDKEQEVDNYVFVDHACANCQSHELFKGIMDDSARATFNGHVLVDEGSVKTEAYQSNKNILLTDKATVTSKPFLEIYNDDVKCSHGSTTGQIDEQQMFYIRSRGISERTARTMLLYAFCDEVIQKIGLATLRERLSDMVKKRLHGELTACADCALYCNTPCADGENVFVIDPTKL
ncbi:MAG: Fe-S cluster assembly protein SufD [Bacteroidales bacterium]|nr:Fe-S cluster assembly protein SufD [Bacteroidales bacterium]